MPETRIDQFWTVRGWLSGRITKSCSSWVGDCGRQMWCSRSMNVLSASFTPCMVIDWAMNDSRENVAFSSTWQWRPTKNLDWSSKEVYIVNDVWRMRHAFDSSMRFYRHRPALFEIKMLPPCACLSVNLPLTNPEGVDKFKHTPPTGLHSSHTSASYTSAEASH